MCWAEETPPQEVTGGLSGGADRVRTTAWLTDGVIEGVWSCWSAWSSCSRGQKSRTCSWNNPAPRNGSRNCTGETIEWKSFEDPDCEHLKMLEPHCFDPSVTPVKTCKTPPSLTNEFVLTSIQWAVRLSTPA